MRTWKFKALKLKLVLEILIFISHLLRMRTSLFCLYFMDMDIIKSLQRLSRQILMLFARLTILVLMGSDSHDKKVFLLNKKRSEIFYK